MAMINAVNEFLDDLRGGSMTEAPIVKVAQGRLQGRVASTPSGKTYCSFQGIPYAKPPLGSLRFKAPQPVEPWEDIRDATAEGNVAAQIDPIFSKQYVGDENCLFLNVYSPNIEGNLPVMVWIHGGGFYFGSGNTDLYGPDYLVEKDVVLVTINYRLGPLGFICLDTPEVPGNAGLRDQILALKWVKDNIQNFGGDPSNITMFGESAGGISTSILTACPLSKDLISKAILQSGTALSELSFQDTPLENASLLAKKLGFEGDNKDELLEFLSATPAKDIIEATENLKPNSFPFVFMLVVEKEFPGVEGVITEPFMSMLSSGRVARIPVLAGSTTLEFAFEPLPELQYYIPKELNIQTDSDEANDVIKDIKRLYKKDDGVDIFNLASDVYVNVHTHRYVQYLKHNINSPIYFYKFDYIGELNLSNKMNYSNPTGVKAALHMDELGYLFSNDYQKDLQPTDSDIKMRERMVRLWTNFAKTGNPTPDENHYIPLTWQPVTKETNYYLNLGAELALGTNYDEEKMAFWDDLYTKHYKIWDQQRHTAVNEVTVPKIVEEETVDSTIVDVQESNGTEVVENQPDVVQVIDEPKIVEEEPKIVEEEPKVVPDVVDNVNIIDIVTEDAVKVEETLQEDIPNEVQKLVNNFKSLDTEVHVNGNGVDKPKPRTSNEIKMVISNGTPKDVIRANDPPEDDLPKNIGVNKFVNFFESLGGKK